MAAVSGSDLRDRTTSARVLAVSSERRKEESLGRSLALVLLMRVELWTMLMVFVSREVRFRYSLR